MHSFLINLSVNHTYWVYLIILVLACAEGPVLSMIFGVLIKLGYFDFLPIYGVLMLGDVLGDSVWYYVGRRYGHGFIRRFGKYVSVTEEGVEKVKNIFHRYTHRILIISKITNGLGLSLVTLITAGIAKIPFWKYLASNIIGQFVWTGLLIGVGYFFGEMYQKVDSVLGRIYLIVLLGVLILLFMGYKKYLRGKAENLTF